MAVLREPADHAVLPGLHRQREAVLQRLRRHAGQLLVLRPVAFAAPAGRPHQRLVHRQRRRRLPVEERSRGSEHRLRALRRTAASCGSICERGVASIRPPQAAGGRGGGGDDEMPGVPQGGPVGARHRARRCCRAAAARRGAAGWPQARLRSAPGAAGCRRHAGRAGAAQGAAAGRTRRPRAGRRPAIASTGMRRTSSARTHPRGCTGRATTSIAPTIAATPGRASARISRAISIATTIPIMGKVWPRGSVALQHFDDAAQQRRVARRVAAARGAALCRHRRRAAAGHGGRREELAQGRGLPRRAEVDVRLRRVRVAARCEHGVRHAQQLAARRLQAVRRRRAPIAAGPGRTSPATCRTGTTCGRSSRITSTATCCSPAPSSACSSASTAAAVGAADAAACRPIQVRDMTVQKRENDLVLATFGRGFYILDDYSALREITPADARRRSAAVPAARRLPVTPRSAWRPPAPPGIGPLSGNCDGAESAVRRGVHLQREAGAARATRSWC